MNKGVVAIVIFGFIICIVAGTLFVASGNSFTSIEEAERYKGDGGEMKLEGYDSGGYLIVIMKGRYEDGTGYAVDGTTNLKQEDCNLVSNFTLKNSDEVNYFQPACENDDDTTEDDWIHVGYICVDDSDTNEEIEKCPDGTYTWDTNGTYIEVHDGDIIIDKIWGGLRNLGGGLLACCCGVIIIIIGIVMAFTLEDPNEPAIDTTRGIPEKKGASSWDEQEDYIHKSDDETKSDFEKADKDGDGKIDENEFADMMKSGMAISKDEKEKPKEKKRSGEYELPPPPEY
jgi:hypothetical protein